MSDEEVVSDDRPVGFKLTVVSVFWIIAAMAIMLVVLWGAYWAFGKFWVAMS